MGLMLLIVIGTSIWVALDAGAIGVRRGQIQGLADMGPGGWFAACLLIWIIAFPLYLSRRGQYRSINSVGASTDHLAPHRIQATHAPTTDPIDQIRRLSELHDCGAVTDDEYNRSKDALLRRIA
jgi:hypothetical protein